MRAWNWKLIISCIVFYMAWKAIFYMLNPPAQPRPTMPQGQLQQWSPIVQPGLAFDPSTARPVDAAK